jgi:hypothetical protein
MLSLVTDEDVHGDIIRGLRRHAPQLELVRAVEVDLQGKPDSEVLDWAVSQGRIVVTQDVKTLVPLAWQRVQAGEPMPGVLALLPGVSIGQAIEEILLVAECCPPEEMNKQVKYIPL